MNPNDFTEWEVQQAIRLRKIMKKLDTIEELEEATESPNRMRAAGAYVTLLTLQNSDWLYRND